MVTEFLQKKQEQYINANTDRREEISRLNTELLETDKFLELLRSESDNFFRDFTPRDINNKNAKKIDELEEKRERLLEKKEQLTSDIDRDDEFLKEVNKALSEVKKLQRDTERLRKKIDKMDREKKEEAEAASEGITKDVSEPVSGGGGSGVSEEKVSEKEIGSGDESEVCKSDQTQSRIKLSDIDRILSFLPADPMRARLELIELKEKL